MPVRTFGRTVRYRRTKLGLSQTKLGELVGRSPSTIRSWERDKSRPNDPHVITTLSAILGIDERTLFEKAGQPQPDIETSPTIEQEMASLTPDTDEKPDTAEEDEPEPASVLLAEPTPQPEPVSTEVPTFVAPPETHVVTTTLPPVHEPSYMEDRSQRRLYQVRNLATIAILAALSIAFVWALTEGLGSLGAWWDDFFGSLRL